MALKITRAYDPLIIEQLVLCLYGPPGTGKTTVAFSAAAPILLDFDRGAHRAKIRRDSVQVQTWQDAANITPDDVADFQSIVVDTAGRALDMLAADIIRRNPKLGRGGQLTLQGYGQLKTEFTAWVKSLRELRKDVVLIAHSSEDTRGDDVVERIDIQGGSKGEIYKVADAMGRLQVIRGHRLPVLTFSPSDAAFGKNPGELDEINVPHIETEPHFFADVIGQIKERINAMTDEQQRRQKVIEDWIAKIREAGDAEAVNALIPAVNEADEGVLNVVRGALKTHAQKKLGLQYSKSAEGYIDPPKDDAPADADAAVDDAFAGGGAA